MFKKEEKGILFNEKNDEAQWNATSARFCIHSYQIIR